MKNINFALLILITFFSSLVSAQSESAPRYCQGRRFKPCVCAPDVPITVSYRVSYEACGGNAAIITRGKYLNIFSAVVRDKENRDRWPRSGFGGCSSRLANSAAPPNRCSAFKAQRTFYQQNLEGEDERVFCLGAPGTSTLFRNVVRITAKLQDVPGSSRDPLARWCLSSPTEDLN